MQIVVERHDSAVLAGNPLGDPSTREVWVSLPDGCRDGARRYPVLWCLAPYAGSGPQQVGGTGWSPGLAERFARLVAQGCPPAIIVFPDCFTRWGGSQYVNSSALGRYEDYLCDELVPWVDARFPTLAHRDARGVLGKSSGGYGALRLAMRRPELFGAFACHSGDMSFAHCYLPDFARAAAALQRAGSVQAFQERFEKYEKKRGEDFAVVSVLAMAAAYSPNPGAPAGFDLPFDVDTAELVEPVWRRWKEHDPVEMIDRPEHQQALRSMRLAFFDCGTRDEHQLHAGLQRLRRKLTALGVPHEAEDFDDGHRSTSYRYDVSLPKLARALTPP